VDLQVLDVHVRPHLGPPRREVPRGLEDLLGTDGRLIDDVNRWHRAILVREPES
jgi:hypothetical protein